MSVDLYHLIYSDITRFGGSISFSRFMELALYHPRFGYYNSCTPIFSDFVTSPEVSQLFGECICLWSVLSWEAMGRPSDVAIIELGPGLGTMMYDFLHMARNFPMFYGAISVQMMECSAKLRAIQQKKLGDFNDVPITWSNEFYTTKPALFVANEFLDALPINQYVFHASSWHENRVFTDGSGFYFSKVSTDLKYKSQNEGDILEISEAKNLWLDKINSYIKLNLGKCLIIDYGYLKKPYVSTIQSLHKRNRNSLFSNIGESDITSYVDFSCMDKVITQREFLQKMGIDILASKLLKKASKKQEFEILSGLDRLTSVLKMGNLFKVAEM